MKVEQITSSSIINDERLRIWKLNWNFQ